MLDSICFFGCEEYDELKEAIQTQKKIDPPIASSIITSCPLNDTFLLWESIIQFELAKQTDIKYFLSNGY